MDPSKSEEVKKAAATVSRGINRLIALLATEDMDVVLQAGFALGELGATAVVGPLAAALPRAKLSNHRLAILGMLAAYEVERKGQVAGALADALRRERHPDVIAVINAAAARMALADVVCSSRRGR